MNNTINDYDMNAISEDIINKNNTQQIDWKNTYIDNKNKNSLKVIPKPSMEEIVNLSSPSNFLDSPFKEDMCEKYNGDYTTLQRKCKQLSVETCKIPSCCVLLNGAKCVAGDINGPIFLTEHGKTIDYTYYYNNNNCYGECDVSDTTSNLACAKYNNNSTNVSKECMIEMFNRYGCPNKTPETIINADMVSEYKDISKQYIEKFIKDSVYSLLNKTDTANKIVCNGE